MRTPSPAPATPMCVPPLILILLLLLVQECVGMTIQAIEVPPMVEAGQGVRLVCVFDPGLEELYSVKWYKDEVEFFRFLPREKPQNQYFDHTDIEVDVFRSHNATVFLKNAGRSAEGVYKCEVSADAPSFQSISSEKFMAVEDRPMPTSRSAHFSRWTWFSAWTIITSLVLCQ